MSNLGYDDTPFISGNPYRVHDGTRPQPRVVTPGGADCAPPSDAVVLFDGSSLDGWVSCKDTSQPAGWKVEDDYMEVVPGTGNIETKELLGDVQLHLEFSAPTVIKGEGQGRGNSGVFMMKKYEIQVLDNYENPTYPDGTCGGLYGQCPPLVNALKAPGEWNHYNIVWVAPRFRDGKLISPARVTVLLNGIVLHHDKELIGPTQHRVTTVYEEHDPKGPLELQDHGDLVRFRNIWYRNLTDYDEG